MIFAGGVFLQLGFVSSESAQATNVELASADRSAEATANRGSARSEITTSSVIGAAEAVTTPTVPVVGTDETATLVPVTEAPTTTVPPVKAAAAPPTTKAPAKAPAPVPATSLRKSQATPTTTAAPAPPAPAASAPAVAADDAVWLRLAKCEAGGRNDLGAPYYGYFQFSAATWKGIGGTGLPSDHSWDVQLEMAKKLQARSGWGQWPHCGKVALRG